LRSRYFIFSLRLNGELWFEKPVEQKFTIHMPKM
jgi:hypothetical protein